MPVGVGVLVAVLEGEPVTEAVAVGVGVGSAPVLALAVGVTVGSTGGKATARKSENALADAR